MEHQIYLLTVSQQIPTGGAGVEPFAPYSSVWGLFSFQDPVLSRIYLQDDDGLFQTALYTPGETQQVLTQPAVVGYGAGETTLAVGTQLSNFIGSVLVDSNGNRFVAIFPRDFDPDDFGLGLGGQHSIMVFPRPVSSSDGSVSFPTFDPSGQFRYLGAYIPETGNDGLLYMPAPVVVHPEDPDGPPCLAQDTLVQTAQGLRAVQELRPGDLILTRDHGLQLLLWSGARHLGADHLDLMPQHRPIRIAAGALGRDTEGQPRPGRTMTVSPQHRVLLASRIAERMFGAAEILLPSRRLVGLPGIEVQRPVTGVTYWHLLFARHQILLTENAWTESLLPGPQALRAFGSEARLQITTLVPALVADPVPARPIPPGHAQRRLVQRHLANPAQALQEADPQPAL